MKRLLFIPLIFLCSALWAGDSCKEPVQLARMNPYIAGAGVAAAACNYTGCSAGCKLFDWDASTAAMASNVCSMGDNTAGLIGEADLTTAPGFVTILDTSDNGGDYYRFDISSYDIFPAGNFTIEFTINFSVIGNLGRIITVSFDASNTLYIDFVTAAGNDIRVRHTGNGTLAAKTFDTNLNTSTSYTVIIKGSTSAGMAISTNGGSSYTTDATVPITTMTHSGTVSNGLVIGSATAVNQEGTIDNVRISYGWRTDI